MDNRTIEELKVSIKTTISDIFDTKSTKCKYKDIILNKFITDKEMKICHKIKTIQMKIGNIWQNVIGSIDAITNLKTGHKSGLDILSDKYKFGMELKNAHNTCNSGSKMNCYDKLIDFKKKNTEYEVIFAYVNCNTKNNIGKDEIIIHKSQQIRILSGNKLLSYLFGDKYEDIIDIIISSLQDFL